ncbi:MAG: hypothetical protein WAL25_13590 [Acidimicrobiia bacterium]
MSEPTPRQVLYALVGAGFVLVVSILVVGAAVAGLVPAWWSGVMALLVIASGAWMARNWRRTGPVLIIAIGLFVVWTTGTLILAT